MCPNSSLTEHEDTYEVPPPAPHWILVRVSPRVTAPAPKPTLTKSSISGSLVVLCCRLSIPAVWAGSAVVESESVPCSLMGEGFQRAAGLGLLAALTPQRAGAHTFFLLKKGGAMGCAPGPASEGRKRQGLSDVTQHGSIWAHPASIAPTQEFLQSLRALGWHPQHLSTAALLLSLPSWEQGFIEEVSCLLLLLLLQSWPFATLPPSCWYAVPHGFFISLG